MSSLFVAVQVSPQPSRRAARLRPHTAAALHPSHQAHRQTAALVRARRTATGFNVEELRDSRRFSKRAGSPSKFTGPVALGPFSGFNTELLSNISTLAIKAVLRRCDRINVRVVSKNVMSLLGGTVDEVRVEGEGWESPGGLSCRSISVQTDAIRFDLQYFVSTGQIRLVTPSNASSRLVLNAQDFNRFVSSPILRGTFPVLMLQGEEIRFVGVESIDESSVASKVEYGGRALVCVLRVQPGGKIAFESAEEREAVGAVDAAAAGVAAEAIGRELEGFFNGMVVDLSGLILKVARFEIHRNSMAVTAEGQITRFPSALVSL